MKLTLNIFHFSLFIFHFFAIIVLATGCAQIGAPTGGAKDSIPPVLIKATPENGSINISNNKITLTFDEYIDVRDAQTNVLVSPYPKANPIIDYRLKTVTIRLKDTLLPNTTYSIDFGNAIRDNNEGNPFKNFTYVFSTGSTIDSLQLTGKVILAENGKIDTTMTAMLYKIGDDSMVQKRKPDYIARLNNEGEFVFKNLAAGSYNVYALKDGDGGKTYNSPIESFAFLNEPIILPQGDSVPVMYAYTEEKDTKKSTSSPSSAANDKRLRYTTSINTSFQDLLSDLEINFSKPLKDLDKAKIILTDTNYKSVNYTLVPDSIQKNITLKTKWVPDTDYKLIISKDAATDSAGNQIFKTDTLSFKTKGIADYGGLTIRFTNLGKSHQVLQFFQNDELKKSVPIVNAQWSDKLFPPGDYELRILYDTNNDGKWTPGNYSKKKQPEKVVTLDKRLAIKANWDNEREIQLIDN
ncbi:MAG: Ig-like domain-containing domain [Bacteroidota bacterium]